MDRVSSNIVKNDFKEEKARRKDRLDHICDLVDLEWNGSITRDELVRRLTALCEKEHKIIKLSKEMSYRVVDNELQFKWLQENEEWIVVTDLTELKVWQYNELVDELNKHYPDYAIEYLEGRFV